VAAIPVPLIKGDGSERKKRARAISAYILQILNDFV
jgi:hypothetical protein